MQNSIKDKFISGLTWILWGVLALLAIWLIISISWWCISVFIFKDIFIPYIVESSIQGLAIVLLWIAFTLICLKLIERKAVKFKNSSITDNFDISMRDYGVHIYENSIREELSEGERSLVSIYDENNIQDLNPTELLSYSVNLLLKGNYSKSLSILRIIVSKENTSPVIKYSAYSFMNRILNDEILNKIA